MTFANLLYGSYSLTLASRRRPLPFILLLIAANAAWALFCFFQLWSHAAMANLLGRAHLAFEGLFVGSLAALEWRFRHTLAR